MIVRTAVKWGVILGVAVCIWTMGLHVLGWYTTNLRMGLIADQVAIVLPVVILFLGIREYWTRAARTPALGQSLLLGGLAGLVSVPLTAGFLWIYHHVINPRWLEFLTAHERERLTAEGAAPQVIDSAVARLQSSGSDAAQLSGALIGTLIISVLIGFISWAALRLWWRRRQPA